MQSVWWGWEIKRHALSHVNSRIHRSDMDSAASDGHAFSSPSTVSDRWSLTPFISLLPPGKRLNTFLLCGDFNLESIGRLVCETIRQKVFLKATATLKLKRRLYWHWSVQDDTDLHCVVETSALCSCEHNVTLLKCTAQLIAHTMKGNRGNDKLH